MTRSVSKTFVATAEFKVHSFTHLIMNTQLKISKLFYLLFI